MTLTDFLLARIAEDEREANIDENIGHLSQSQYDRTLAECRAKWKIVEWHQNWPVLAQTQPKFDPDDTDPQTMTFRMSQQIAWMTEREYRARFGSEPPTSPILLFLALPYADHPDYNPDWRP